MNSNNKELFTNNYEDDEQQYHQQQQHDNYCFDDKNNFIIRNNKNLDYPPYSRLFVLYPKTATENELRVEFERYGPIEDLWVVREKETGQSKGINV